MSVSTTEVIQIENPADFVPSFVPEQSYVAPKRNLPKVTPSIVPVAHPKPPEEQRPKSGDRPPRSARFALPAEPTVPM